MKNTILVTGAAGFIGFHICKRILKEGFDLIGLDNLNSYYDIELKKERLKELNKIAAGKNTNWIFLKRDLREKESIQETFEQTNPQTIIHLAAQAGIRYSLQNPEAYISSNINGFLNILENCKDYKIKNLIYASSSSVYGGNTKVPFSELDNVDHPVSTYAVTKRTNELMAHAYSHLYNMPCTGLRFFTVYGPWGRPDMAPMLFSKAILSNEKINIFNKGNMSRDFTYIDDVTEILFRLINKPATIDQSFNKDNPTTHSSWAPHRIFNVGNNESVNLMDFISILEKELGKKATKNFMEFQKGDVQNTRSDSNNIYKWIKYKPSTPLEKGIREFVKWYKIYYENSY